MSEAIKKTDHNLTGTNVPFVDLITKLRDLQAPKSVAGNDVVTSKALKGHSSILGTLGFDSVELIDASTRNNNIGSTNTIKLGESDVLQTAGLGLQGVSTQKYDLSNTIASLNFVCESDYRNTVFVYLCGNNHGGLNVLRSMVPGLRVIVVCAECANDPSDPLCMVINGLLDESLMDYTSKSLMGKGLNVSFIGPNAPHVIGISERDTHVLDYNYTCECIIKRFKPQEYIIRKNKDTVLSEPEGNGVINFVIPPYTGVMPDNLLVIKRMNSTKQSNLRSYDVTMEYSLYFDNYERYCPHKIEGIDIMGDCCCYDCVLQYAVYTQYKSRVLNRKHLPFEWYNDLQYLNEQMISLMTLPRNRLMLTIGKTRYRQHDAVEPQSTKGKERQYDSDNEELQPSAASHEHTFRDSGKTSKPLSDALPKRKRVKESKNSRTPSRESNGRSTDGIDIRNEERATIDALKAENAKTQEMLQGMIQVLKGLSVSNKSDRDQDEKAQDPPTKASSSSSSSSSSSRKKSDDKGEKSETQNRQYNDQHHSHQDRRSFTQSFRDKKKYRNRYEDEKDKYNDIQNILKAGIVMGATGQIPGPYMLTGTQIPGHVMPQSSGGFVPYQAVQTHNPQVAHGYVHHNAVPSNQQPYSSSTYNQYGQYHQPQQQQQQEQQPRRPYNQPNDSK